MNAPIHKERFRRPYLLEAQARLRPVFEDFHLLSAEGRFDYPRHRHSNYEVILVTRGPYRCELNEVEILLKSGEMLVVKPGDWHSDRFQDGQRHFVLHFRIAAADPSSLEPRLFREGVTPSEQVIAGEQGYNVALLDELRREAVEANRFAGAVQDALLEALFWRIVRNLPSGALSPEMRRMPREEKDREELAAAFTDWLERPAKVSDVARTLKVSVRQLANRCRLAYDESPANLLLEFKIRRAEELLSNRGLRVQEVSHRLGFSNPYHFSRVFKRRRGRTPSSVARGE